MLSISLFPLLFGLTACGDKDDTGTLISPIDPNQPTDEPEEEEVPLEEDSGLPTDTIEIVGVYESVEGGLISIDENTWEMGPAQFNLTQYDNDEDYTIGQNDTNNPNHPERWSKFEWVFDGGGSILYCQSVHDASLEDDALNAEGANSEDFAQGCQGNSWTAIRTALDITGEYQDSAGINHRINAWQWVQEGAGSTELFYVTTINNEEGWLIAENGVDNATNPNLWSVFQWTTDSDNSLYYCHSSNDAEMKEDAMNQDFADADDLTSGCKGSAWNSLERQ